MWTLLAQVIPTAPVTNSAAVDFSWLFIKMLLVLGVVSVAAMLILKFAVPRIGIMKRFQQDKYFNVIGRHALAPGKFLYLVQTGKRYLVIGVADHGINLVTELTEEEAKTGIRDSGLGTRKTD